MFKTHLATNKYLKEDIQYLLLKNNKNRFIKENLALNTSINKEIQLILAEYDTSNYDRKPWIRENLASNISIDKETQRILLHNYNSYSLLKILAENPSISKETQLRLIKADIKHIDEALDSNSSLCKKALAILKEKRRQWR